MIVFNLVIDKNKVDIKADGSLNIQGLPALCAGRGMFGRPIGKCKRLARYARPADGPAEHASFRHIYIYIQYNTTE